MLIHNKWESEFFAKRIYQLDLSQWDCVAFSRQLVDIKPDLVAVKVSAQDNYIVNDLMLEGFKLIDVAVSFKKNLIKHRHDKMNQTKIAKAVQADLAPLMTLAQEAIVYSRFSHPAFGAESKSRLYGEWVAQAVAGAFDDICLVSKSGSVVEGFVTCRNQSHQSCRVGLIAVAEHARGMGLGRRLMIAAERYAAEQSATYLHVATQYANKAAMACYAGLGYQLDALDLWLYWVPGVV